jgi:hypothetical protein
MARQTKVGLDYFSHDVDMLQDKKIKILKAKHGLIGYAIYLRLLEELYREDGYYLKIDEDFNILFSDDNKIDYNVYILILNDCIEKDLFNSKMYKKHNILTSERIQNNYISGTDRRKGVSYIKEYLLLKPKELHSEKVNVIIESLNVNINSLNDNTGTQSKGKNSKEEKSTVNKNVYFGFDKVKLLEEEYKTCIETYGEDKTKQAIESLHHYKMSSGKKYKSDYGTLNSWVWDKVKAVKLSEIKKQDETICEVF